MYILLTSKSWTRCFWWLWSLKNGLDTAERTNFKVCQKLVPDWYRVDRNIGNLTAAAGEAEEDGLIASDDSDHWINATLKRTQDGLKRVNSREESIRDEVLEFSGDSKTIFRTAKRFRTTLVFFVWYRGYHGKTWIITCRKIQALPGREIRTLVCYMFSCCASKLGMWENIIIYLLE